MVRVTAKELLDSGQLSAQALIKEEVKANPDDAWRLASLLDLLRFAGDLDPAATQLNTISLEGVEVDLAVQPYRKAIAAEWARQRSYSEGFLPHYLSLVMDAASQLRAIEHFRGQDYVGALSALEESEEARLLTPGLNGIEINDLKDADDLLGPFLEAFVDGQYTRRDLVCTSAFIELHSVPLYAVALPARYEDSYHDASDQVKPNRLTKWRVDIPRFLVGAGQEILSVREQDYGLLELGSIEFRACQLPA